MSFCAPPRAKSLNARSLRSGRRGCKTCLWLAMIRLKRVSSASSVRSLYAGISLLRYSSLLHRPTNNSSLAVPFGAPRNSCRTAARRSERRKNASKRGGGGGGCSGGGGGCWAPVVRARANLPPTIKQFVRRGRSAADAPRRRRRRPSLSVFVETSWLPFVTVGRLWPPPPPPLPRLYTPCRSDAPRFGAAQNRNRDSIRIRYDTIRYEMLF